MKRTDKRAPCPESVAARSGGNVDEACRFVAASQRGSRRFLTLLEAAAAVRVMMKHSRKSTALTLAESIQIEPRNTRNTRKKTGTWQAGASAKPGHQSVTDQCQSETVRTRFFSCGSCISWFPRLSSHGLDPRSLIQAPGKSAAAGANEREFEPRRCTREIATRNTIISTYCPAKQRAIGADSLPALSRAEGVFFCGEEVSPLNDPAAAGGRTMPDNARSRSIVAGILVALLVPLAAGRAQAELSLQWKKEFDSRIVKAAWRTEPSVSNEGRPRFPLRAVMTEKSVFALDPMGKVEKTISLAGYEKAALSDDGTTLATLNNGEITVASTEGRIIGAFKIADPEPEVLPEYIDFTIAPDGRRLVVVSWFAKTVYFHDSAGKLLSRHTFDDLRGASVRFSKDGRRVAIHVPNWGEGKTSGFLVVFSGSGEQLWRFEHAGCEAQFAISSDGDSIALAAQGRIHSLDGKGNVKFSGDIDAGPVLVALSGDGSRIAVAKQSDHSVTLLDSRSGDALWSNEIPGFDPIDSPITSLSVADDAGVVAVAVNRHWKMANEEARFIFYDAKGRQKSLYELKESGARGLVILDGVETFLTANKTGGLFDLSGEGEDRE
ncbi:MAG: PQQ-binding-like beta-propeller repeat protein [bacterium]